MIGLWKKYPKETEERPNSSGVRGSGSSLWDCDFGEKYFPWWGFSCNVYEVRHAIHGGPLLANSFSTKDVQQYTT